MISPFRYRIHHSVAFFLQRDRNKALGNELGLFFTGFLWVGALSLREGLDRPAR